MKLPSTVAIGQSTYAITEGAPKGYLGRTHKRKQVIQIEPTQGAGSRRDTLLHESLHALLHESGGTKLLDVDDDAEERLIRLLSPWLLMLLRDNPDLVAFLLAP